MELMIEIFKKDSSHAFIESDAIKNIIYNKTR